MQERTVDRLEIFFALARRAGQKPVNGTSDPEAGAGEHDGQFAPILGHLNASEKEAFQRILKNYDRNPVEVSGVLRRVGTEPPASVDKNIHRSHINAALRNESPAVRAAVSSVISRELDSHARSDELQKRICQAFLSQFTSLEDLSAPTAFDHLTSTQLVRLIRLSGIREVAVACSGIEEVESVAAFLRRFSEEDARAIAAQLASLHDVSEARLIFAEGLVQAMLESESQPSEALDLLGIRLVGIALGESTAARVAYTHQKLPREITPQLPEIVELGRRKTPKNLRHKVNAEVELLAEAIARTSENAKPRRGPKK